MLSKQDFESLFRLNEQSEEVGVYASSQGMFGSNDDVVDNVADYQVQDMVEVHDKPAVEQPDNVD